MNSFISCIKKFWINEKLLFEKGVDSENHLVSCQSNALSIVATPVLWLAESNSPSNGRENWQKCPDFSLG